MVTGSGDGLMTGRRRDDGWMDGIVFELRGDAASVIIIDELCAVGRFNQTDKSKNRPAPTPT